MPRRSAWLLLATAVLVLASSLAGSATEEGANATSGLATGAASPLRDKLHEVARQPLVMLGVLLLAAEVGGEAFRRLFALLGIDAPHVIGYMLAGILIGPSFLGLVVPEGEAAAFLRFFQVFAVFLMLFSAGLETEIGTFKGQGKAMSLTAFLGAGVSFVLGFALYWYVMAPPGMDPAKRMAVSLIMGAAFTPTSVSVPALILQQMRRSTTLESAVIIGAATIDDVIGLVVLAIVSSLIISTGTSSLGGVALTSAVSIAFALAWLLIAMRLIPLLTNLAVRLGMEDLGARFSLGLGFVGGIIGELAFGLSSSVVAYITGLATTQSRAISRIREYLAPLFGVLSPVFFVTLGVSVDVSQMTNVPLTLFFLIALAATLGKVFGSMLGCLMSSLSLRMSIRVGMGMIPHGEVASIIATLALEQRIIGLDIYGAIIGMVIFTGLVTPSLMVKSFEE